MPGRVIMSSSSANGAGGAVNGKTQPTDLGRVDAPADAMTGIVNGDALANGNTPKASSRITEMDQTAVNGAVVAPPAHASLADLPPEILHITEGYEPLGKLIGRIVQECFNDLNEVVDKLATIPVPPPLTNGASHAVPSGPGNISQANIQKKMAWLDFANSHREQFIKLMVISQWSVNAESVKQLIDLMFWSNEQTQHYERAATALGQLKIDLHSFKMPSPDIPTALEVLSTGKASWMPDLGYIPLKPLTAKKMLQTLKTMNALLSIRLNLHEDLPISMRNWKIANGRATFTFPSEFEFDVTIADEDPLRQLYFVDVRFLFKPAPEIPEGPIRNALQFRADEALLNSKIPGCAEFLRNFVLTHQITTLGRQAYALSRSSWVSAIRIEPIHRSLIVQYWAESPFPKSWLEIGINSEAGKKRLLPGHVEVPSIKAKWKRYGVEVKDSELDLRLSDLDLEGILKRAIAAHILEILRATKEKLQQSVEGIRRVWKTESQTLRIELQESADEPIDCSLKLRLGQFSPEVTFTIEPVSGRLCLQPLTAISKRAEWDLGLLKNPLLEVHEKLDTYLCFDMLWRIERQANHSGWQQIRNLSFPEHTLKDRFRGEVRGYGYFRPAGWEDAKSTWLVAVTVNLEGEKWWVIERETSASEGNTIVTVQPLPSHARLSGEHPINIALFRTLGHLATRTVELYATIRELKEYQVPNDIRYTRPETLVFPKVQNPIDASLVARGKLVPSLCVRFSRLLADFAGAKQHFADLLQLSYVGFDEFGSKAQFAVRGALRNSESITPLLISAAASDPDLNFNSHGAFLLLIETQIGDSLMETLTSRIRLLVRQISLLRGLKHNKLTPTEATLSTISFAYSSSDPSLSCSINLPATHTAPVTLSLLPANTNPHQRVLAHLQASLSLSQTTFLKSLTFTLPLLRALQRIEGNSHANIRCHGLVHYRLVYRRVPTVFDIRTKSRRDNLEFWIFELPPPGSQSQQQQQGQHGQQQQQQPAPNPLIAERPPGYEETVREWLSSSGNGYRGLRSGVACSSDGIEAALDDLDARIGAVLTARDAAARKDNSSSGTGNGTNSTSQQAPVNGARPPLTGKKSGGVEPAAKKGSKQGPHEVVVLD